MSGDIDLATSRKSNQLALVYIIAFNLYSNHHMNGVIAVRVKYIPSVFHITGQ